jgi:hypothetical protein
MDAVACIDFNIARGADWRSQTFTWTYSDTGALVDLTGVGCRFTIRSSPDVTTASIIELTSGGGVTLGNTAGTIIIALTKAQTIALPRGPYPYTFFIDFTDGTSKKVLVGLVYLDP